MVSFSPTLQLVLGPTCNLQDTGVLYYWRQVSGVSKQMTDNRVQIKCFFFQYFAICLPTSILRKLTPDTIETVLLKNSTARKYT